MRSYWLRIALGAVVIFAVGMVAMSLVRRGLRGVREVAEGSGPITLPVAFVPFKLDGEKLGTIDKVVLHRDAPKSLVSVELQIKLLDSILARGLEGCRLAANFDGQSTSSEAREADATPLSRGVFSCLRSDDSTGHLQEFGHAVFQPGGVSVPLLLPNDMVADLKQGNFTSGNEDSVEAAVQARADSINDEAEERADSIATAAEARADSIMARGESMADSLRNEGLRRADSARRAVSQMADTGRGR
jgi:hypothetical protein